MRTRECTFYSDGVRLDGVLQCPDGAAPAGGFPVIVVCSGYQGLKELIPGKLWQSITDAGFACFSFDYRGFGTSDGDSGRLIPAEQVEDVYHGVTWLTQQDDIDAGRIGLIGWGFGGGIALQAAADDSRVCAIASLSGIGDGGRAVRDSYVYADWLALQQRLQEEEIKRTMTGESTRVSPWVLVPLEPGTRGDVDREMYAKHERFGIEMYLYSAAAYFAFQPEKAAARISPRPLLIMHGTHNGLHPIDEARSVYAHAAEPKTLIELPGATHLDWIEPAHPLFKTAMASLTDWFTDALPSHKTGSASVMTGSAV